ncbi:hypothetical protein RRSWK_02657 [Rhodopirellula sp. SWK7]|nr:hypothetical protein RRSWK_02657 [Rhodopirellula sp. SWK7]
MLATASGVIGLFFPPFQYATLVVCLLSVALGLSLLIKRLNQHIWDVHLRSMRIIDMLDENVVAAHAMHVVVSRFPTCDMPTSSWSMKFPNLHALLELLDREEPKLIVEFGSGISTLLIASWIQERGVGRLVSFDHDAEWACKTKHYLDRHSLASVDVRVRPLKSIVSSGHRCIWYDTTEDDLKSLSGVDLVVVDGPPAGATGTPMSRLPAFEVLREQMSPKAVIVLDDASRAGERSVASSWDKSNPDFELSHIANLAILCRTDDGCSQVIGTDLDI